MAIILSLFVICQQCIYIIAILAVILMCVHLFIFRNFKNKHLSEQIARNNDLEEMNQKLRQSEAHLKAVNSTKDHLFSIISHDLRNPFNSLLGISEILCHNADRHEYENVSKFANIINSNAHNLYSQVENLLEWSRMQTNSIKYKPEMLELRILVLNVFTLFEVTAFRKNIDLICEIQSGEIAYADKATITAVLRNLTDNAIKFTKDGGKVIVSSKKIGKFVEISVVDSGVGISTADIHKLFSIDTVYSRRGTSDEKGSGLGLLSCKEFVTKNGGNIDVFSQIDVGTTFIFTLPATNNITNVDTSQNT
jgi:signal transduction histidine kinase